MNALLNLVLFKTVASLRIEVSRYYLNYLWWAIEPVLSMMVFYVVFGIFLNRSAENYVGVLLVGLMAWNWFARSIEHASMSIYQGRGLMNQVVISKLFFPLEVVLRDTFKNSIVVVLLLVFLLFYTTPVSITWCALPVVLLVEAALIFGLAILSAALVPYVPDLQFVISTGLHLMFFGSGVFFRIEDVVLPKHQFLMYLNPMAGLIKAYRDILIYAQWPDWSYLGTVFLCSMSVLGFSIWLVKKLDHDFPRVCNQ
ncbi:MAG: ABC transporter permease [Desulfovibrio sp.]